MELSHTIERSPSRATRRSVRRLSRRVGFWAVAFSFLVVAAFSTAPSSLYGLYEQREHLSSLTITFVYAVYAVGVVGSLLLAGHVSDWYGRRVVLLPAIAVAIAAAAVFLALEVTRGSDRRARAHRRRGRRRGGHGHRVRYRSGLGTSWPADSPGWDRQHDREHWWPGVGSADRRRARALRAARTHAPLPGVRRCPRARGYRCRACARRASARSPSSQIPAAAPFGSGKCAPAVYCRRRRCVSVLRRVRIVRGTGGRVSRRTAAPPVIGAVRLDDLRELRDRRRRPDHDHQLARAPPDRSRNRARPHRAGTRSWHPPGHRLRASPCS